MTTDQEQVLQRLGQLLMLSPDMRIGQLVSNLACMARPEDDEPTPNVDDEELLAACNEHLENIKRVVAGRKSATHAESHSSNSA